MLRRPFFCKTLQTLELPNEGDESCCMRLLVNQDVRSILRALPSADRSALVACSHRVDASLRVYHAFAPVLDTQRLDHSEKMFSYKNAFPAIITNTPLSPPLEWDETHCSYKLKLCHSLVIKLGSLQRRMAGDGVFPCVGRVG